MQQQPAALDCEIKPSLNSINVDAAVLDRLDAISDFNGAANRAMIIIAKIARRFAPAVCDCLTIDGHHQRNRGLLPKPRES
jgi:hypothetical protein